MRRLHGDEVLDEVLHADTFFMRHKLMVELEQRMHSNVMAAGSGQEVATYSAPDAQILCPVCIELKDASLWTELVCGHRFCTDCLVSYLRVAIEEGHTAVGSARCPMPECEGLVGDDILEPLVGHDLWTRHRRYCAMRKIDSDKNLRWCPIADCESAVEVAPGQKRVTCPTCGLQFCAACGCKTHRFKTCAMATDRAYAKWKRSTQAGVKRCPGCNIETEKDGGCRHMSCTKCRFEYCWSCLRPWKSGRCASAWCKVLRINDAPCWGPVAPVRVLSKATFVPVCLGLAAVGGAIVVASAAVLAVAGVVASPGLLIGKAYREHQAAVRRKGWRARVLLAQGINLTLVGFPSLLKTVSSQVPGRWVVPGRTYLAYLCVASAGDPGQTGALVSITCSVCARGIAGSVRDGEAHEANGVMECEGEEKWEEKEGEEDDTLEAVMEATVQDRRQHERKDGPHVVFVEPGLEHAFADVVREDHMASVFSVTRGAPNSRPVLAQLAGSGVKTARKAARRKTSMLSSAPADGGALQSVEDLMAAMRLAAETMVEQL